MMGRSEHSSKIGKKLLGLSAFLVMGILVVGMFVLAYYAQNRQKSYDDNSKAYLPTGGVAQLQLTTPPGTPAAAGTLQKVQLRFSTQRAPVSGLQVIVDVKKASNVNVTFVPNDSATFFMFAKQEEQITGGTRFKLAFGSNPLTAPFNNDVAYRDVGTFQYTQPATGDVVIAFQPETRTIAVDTGDDTLAKPNPLSLTYPGASTQVANNNTSPTPTTASLTSPTPTTSSVATPTPTPTPTTSTQNTGVGGAQVLMCNDTCTSTAQCPVNTFCSSGRCRHVSCPSDSDCVCSPSPTPTTSSSTSGSSNNGTSGSNNGSSQGSSGTGGTSGSGTTGSTGGSRGTTRGSTRTGSGSTGSTGSSGGSDTPVASGDGSAIGGAIIPPTEEELALAGTTSDTVADLQQRYAEQEAKQPEQEEQTRSSSPLAMMQNLGVPTIIGMIVALGALIAFFVIGRRKKPAAVSMSSVKQSSSTPFTSSYNAPAPASPAQQPAPLTPSADPVVPTLPRPQSPQSPNQER